MFGERKDQSDWSGENQGGDTVVEEVREVGLRGSCEGLGFHSGCDGVL